MSTAAPTAGQGTRPRQISSIIGNETCEHCSFCGMRNILVPFLISWVLPACLPQGDERDVAAKGSEPTVLRAWSYPMQDNCRTIAP